MDFPSLFASGRIIDLILALVVVEAALVLGFRRWSGGRGLEPVSFLANLAAGSGLLMAVRSALTGQSWKLVALCLLAGLCAHLVDAGSRWRS